MPLGMRSVMKGRVLAMFPTNSSSKSASQGLSWRHELSTYSRHSINNCYDEVLFILFTSGFQVSASSELFCIFFKI